MKNAAEKVVWGVILVLFGLFLAGKILGLFNFTVFFPGWWTLLIIIPTAINLIMGKNIATNLSGLILGFMLLLNQTDMLDWDKLWKLLGALLFVRIGLSFIFPKDKNKQDNHYYKKQEYRESSTSKQDDYRNSSFVKEEEIEGSYKEADSSDTYKSQESNFSNHNEYGKTNGFYYQNTWDSNEGKEKSAEKTNRFSQYTGFFSIKKEQYVDEVFTGAVINSIFGGVELDLRNAIFLGDTIIDITCIMGGVDIFVPSNIKVVLNCTPIMGGVDCHVKNFNEQSEYTLFIKGSCFMGGVEVK